VLKYFKYLSLIATLFISPVNAQTLPSGSLGTVTGNTRNTWQPFTYTFTPSTSGANFVGFAFREDPAFWTFDNVTLTASGSQTNLLTNGTFTTGGSFSVTTNNGVSNMQAPTNWGVWYQNGTYPAAAGTWTDIGGNHGGVWYDGAVGSFDGIYQGITLTAGTTYTIAFEVSGNNTSNGSSIQLGVYGGACATVSISPDQCTIPSSVGFTTLATPSQGAAAGNPTPPPVTLVSTANAPSTATSSTTYGTSTVAYNVTNARVNSGQWIAVTRTTIPVTTRPFIITTVTTPHTIQTYSDGTTITTNGTTVTTTQNNATITVGQSTAQTASISSTGLKDYLSITRFNPYIVDPLSTKDGTWAEPSLGYAKTTGSFRTSALNFGIQKTVDENTIGITGTINKSNSHEFLNSQSQAETYGATAYILSKQTDIWVKGSVGFNTSEYQTNTSLPIFALANSSKVKVKNYYADMTLYSPVEYFGIRPLIGVAVTNSVIDSKIESGSSLLSTLPQDDKIFEARPYAGARFDFDKNIGIETRITQSKDFKTVGQVRLTAKQEIFDNVLFNVQAGFDKSSNYTAAVGMVGLKWAF
jgi:hypothetical protein